MKTSEAKSASLEDYSCEEHLPILTEEERRLQLVEWNDTATDFPKNTCIHQLFEAQVECTPDAVAVVFEEQQLTYRELNARANQLAHYLQVRKVGPEVLVGVCMERSLEMMVGLLGVLKAGGAYVPLDPAYPQERLAFMLQDIQAPVILTQAHLVASLPAHEAEIICLDANWTRVADEDTLNPMSEVAPGHLAYVIYTSGSTGKPKGVMVTHQNLVHSTWARLTYYDTPVNAFLLLSSFAFDSSVAGIFWTLCQGGRLVLPRQSSVQDLSQITEMITHHRISHLLSIPSFYYLLLEQASLEQLASLQTVIVAGEACPRELPKRHYRRLLQTALFNEYGPTECTVWSSVYELQAQELHAIIPIGRPIANTQVYVLDSSLQPVPIGMPGELHIGGAGLARGYLNRANLTTEKFIPHPFSNDPDARLYKTGDLARYLPDGNIEFLGRIDQQVKIRGFRIELDEIKAVLDQHPAVLDSVVDACEEKPENKQLVAYIVLDPTYKLEEDEANEWKSESIFQWQLLYDETYSSSGESPDPTFNITGWNSSYTGDPLDPEAMREQIEQSVARILSWHPQSVMEIGCGTGLILFRVAPHCTYYKASDFSVEALQFVQKLLPVSQLSQVELFQGMAHDFSNVPTNTFDTIILNSVIQYFPNIDYLIQVLEQAVRVIKPGGFILIGDVRNHALHEAYAASVEFFRASPVTSKSELQKRIYRRVLEEEELLVDPAFFVALQQRLPQIGQVQMQMKRGRHHNELTRFRYDVVLYVGEAETYDGPIVELDWQAQQISPSSIEQLLREQRPEVVRISRMPNARLRTEVNVLAWFRQENSPERVGDMRKVINEQEDIWIDPEDLWTLGEATGYTVSINWSDVGHCEVVFRYGTDRQAQARTVIPPLVPESRTIKPWHIYVNKSLQEEIASVVTSQLRTYLQEKLPAYMVPSAFVLLPVLPRTPNGKVDRRALPTPSAIRLPMGESFVAPTLILHHQLVQVWEELLDVRPIGIRDNFFDLGGHSILAARLVARLEQVFGKKISLSTLFAHPTVEQLANALQGQEETYSRTPVVAVQTSGNKRPFFYLHGAWKRGAFYCFHLARHFGPEQPFYVLEPYQFDDLQVPPTLEAIASAHLQSLRAIQPEGPYLLGGFCNGGLVAYEMARQLHAEGQEVDLLVLIEPDYPRMLGLFMHHVISYISRLMRIGQEKQVECFLRLQYIFKSMLHKIQKEDSKEFRAIDSSSQILIPTTELLRQDKEGLLEWIAMGYNYESYPGKVTLFWTREEPFRGIWRQRASHEKETEVHIIPGTHISCRTDHIQDLAEELRMCLERVQREKQ